MATPARAFGLPLRVYLPLLHFTWAVSLAVTGIAAELNAHYKLGFPSQKLGSLSREIIFGSAFTLAFTTLFCVSSWFARESVAFNEVTQWVIFFIAFLVMIVGSSALAERSRLFGFDSGPDAFAGAKRGLWRGLLGMSWILTIAIVACLAVLSYSFVRSARAAREAAKAGRRGAMAEV